MAGMLQRLLVIDGMRDFACRVGGIAERLGFATRILQHTLDIDYVLRHWRPDIVMLQTPMPDQQDLQVLNYLKRFSFPGRLLFVGGFRDRDLELAVIEARNNGLTVTAVLTRSSTDDEIESALKLLLNLEHAA